MTERKNRRTFDLQLLNDVIKRDEAILLNTYSNLNRNTIVSFICKCGVQHSKVFRSLSDQGGAYCTKCSNILAQDKLKKKMLDTYGVEHAFQFKDFKEKALKTMRDKYGVEHAMKSSIIKNKANKTIKERYGVDNLSQSSAIQQKIKENSIQKYGVDHPAKLKTVREKTKQTMLTKYGAEYSLQVKEFKEKAINTTIEKFGVENASQSEVIKEKKKQTCLKNYGVESPFQSTIIREKIANTMINKYGVTNPLKNKIIKEKTKQTNIETYGVPNPMQCANIQEKSFNNSHKFKDYKMPSGEIRRVQGYEPFAINDLLEKYTEEQIKTNRNDVPRIKYSFNDKDRYYFPDIFIPAQNLVIEVKSTYTIKCNPGMIKAKQEATINNGYFYELWVYDDKGIRIINDHINQYTS